MIPQLNPVTRLNFNTVSLNNGVTLRIVHDLPEETYKGLFNKWLRLTKKYTWQSLIAFVKERKPYCICVTKEQYDEITTGKSTPATEAEWLAQNN